MTGFDRFAALVAGGFLPPSRPRPRGAKARVIADQKARVIADLSTCYRGPFHRLSRRIKRGNPLLKLLNPSTT